MLGLKNDLPPYLNSAAVIFADEDVFLGFDAMLSQEAVTLISVIQKQQRVKKPSPFCLPTFSVELDEHELAMLC